ncbi:sortase domain-containing protein [Lasius niger]|uniref:Sortase domain-containing protein n=1 Tax=Lasius niger TaxID=67767 RepID=A0A0J7JYS4_LASNI|nr:sortase domain-containing protein [Lasius niger]
MKKMEPEIITIEDSDDEVEVIEDDVVMEVNEVNEVNEAEEEEAGSDDEMGSDVEIEPNSGSDYNSECNTRIQNLRTAEIIAMNDDTKMCAIHMYYSPWFDATLCARCFMRLRDLYSFEINAVRIHKTGRYDQLLGRWCTDCNSPLDQLFIRNMCPVCHTY